MPYRSTKTYGHDCGLSVAFRQWKADGHCKYLHGYALAISLEFEALSLDARNWVMDFGGLREVKQKLVSMFDHTTLVAIDDPELPIFKQMADAGIIQFSVVQAVGCEAFAAMVFEWVSCWLEEKAIAPRVRLTKVEVREHGANSAMVVA